jgi:predicted esterase
MHCKTRRHFFFLLLIAYAFHANVFSQIDYKGFPQWSKHQRDSTEYYLYTPSNKNAGQKLPIVLFMHGCCGVDYHASLRNCVDPPVRMWHSFGENKQYFMPTYIIAPATSRGWEQHFKNLKAVIDDLIANHNGDPQRVYVCGFSMGGDGTVRILQAYPGFFAAAIPMGMSFHGDSTLLKGVPIWTAQGETDWWARDLKKNVADIRRLNGLSNDTGATWVEGVYPIYSNFKGVGHGVQWDAASTLPLVAWAYSQVNDGNKSPKLVFTSPGYRSLAVAGKPVTITIQAWDDDGHIAEVKVYHNRKLLTYLNKAPYTFKLIPEPGDNIITAIAYDNKLKFSRTETVIKVNNSPAFLTGEPRKEKIGSPINMRAFVTGNGNIRYRLEGNLPKGLRFYEDGALQGLILEKGSFKYSIWAIDEDNDSTKKDFVCTVDGRDSSIVLITDAVTKNGRPYEISSLVIGEMPNFDSKKARLSGLPEEINFSNLDKYAGLPYIKTDINDTSETAPDFLSFNIDTDATVYVAYEKFDNLLTSTVPDWLKDWKKEEGEIVAQYRYFDVYSKRFPKGKVTLPGADAKRNGVVCNYFVIVKKSG